MTTGCTGTALSGTLNNLGGGQFQVFNGAIVIGTAITFTSGSQKVVVVDLNNATSGRGLLVGSQQESATTAQTNGTWVGTSSNQGNFKFVVSGSGSTVTATQQTFNDVANITARTATLNSPWAGMVSDGAGGIAILAGTGVYAAVVSTLPNGYAEIGVKLP